VVEIPVVAALDVPLVGVRAVVRRVLCFDNVADLLWRDALRVGPDDLSDELEESNTRGTVVWHTSPLFYRVRGIFENVSVRPLQRWYDQRSRPRGSRRKAACTPSGTRSPPSCA
jgi:hypothetical protein